MNDSVITMINKLHARLDDLAEVVSSIPFELSGYDKRLDRIDDQVYLIEVELEKKMQGSVPLTPLSSEESKAFDVAAGEQAASKAAKSSVHIVDEQMNADDLSQVRIASSDGKDGDDEEPEGFLTDSAKETIAGATKTLNSLYKDGKEVVGEFSEAFGDIKEVFSKNPFKKHR
jgi:hypothetical protein